MIARGLEVGERAEAYLRLPAGPQNLLGYRELRVWMRGRGPGWEEGDLQAFIKVGSDDRNFYLYRAPAHTTTWEPEFVIDLEVWRRLRAELESRWLSGAPASGAAECGSLDPNAFVACDGPYLVHLADPGINPPNLAAVQEVSAGIYRVAGTVTVPEAELWVDDIRLTSPVSQMGTAMAMDARLVASDVGGVSASFVRQNGQFRQINQDPTYRTTGTFQLNTNWRLDRFLPTSLGLSVPITVSYTRSNVTPELLTGTDLRGDALAGLREPRSWSANYNLAIRRTVRGRSWLTRGFLDPLSLATTLTQGHSRTELSEANDNAYSMLLGYNLQLQRRGPRLPFRGVVKGLPSWIRESEGGKALANATFSLVPTNFRASSGLSRDQADNSLFAVPVARSDDSLIRPTLSLTHLWRNSGGLTWQPLGMLSLERRPYQHPGPPGLPGFDVPRSPRVRAPPVPHGSAGGSGTGSGADHRPRPDSATDAHGSGHASRPPATSSSPAPSPAGCRCRRMVIAGRSSCLKPSTTDAGERSVSRWTSRGRCGNSGATAAGWERRWRGSVPWTSAAS